MADKPKRKKRSKPTQLSSFVNSKKKKPQRPSRTQLKAIYKQLLNPTVEARVAALISVCHWYDHVVEYCKSIEKKNLQLQTLTASRALASADELRQLSFNTTKEADKEHLLIKTVEKLELATKGLIRVKPVSYIYGKLKKLKSKLARREGRLQAKHERVINFLQGALKPKNANGNTVLLKVGEIGKDRSTSSDMRTMLYSRQHAKQMMETFRHEGFMLLVAQELPWLAKVASFVRDASAPTGYKPDLEREKVAVAQMWKHVVDYCRANPYVTKRLVRTPRTRRRKRK